MKIQVSGADGFIGSNLRRELESNGHEVNKDMAMEAGVHLKAWANVEGCQQDPQLAVRRNVEEAADIVQTWCTRGARLVVYVSTTAVYADSEHRITPSDKARPLNVYAATKLAGEQVVRAITHAADVGLLILRLPNVYGPGQLGGRARGVIARTFEAIMRGKSLPRWPHAAHEMRDYVHVKDVVNLIRFMVSVRGMAMPEVAIAATGRMTSTAKVIDMCEETWRDEHGEWERKGVPRLMNVSAQPRAPRHAGYRPNYLCETELEHGLVETAQWWLEHGAISYG